MKKKLPGVYETKQKNGTLSYRSSITYKSKHISLGSYQTPEAAYNAYKAAGTLLSASGTVLEDFSPKSHLPFAQWVILCPLPHFFFLIWMICFTIPLTKS